MYVSMILASMQTQLLKLVHDARGARQQLLSMTLEFGHCQQYKSDVFLETIAPDGEKQQS